MGPEEPLLVEDPAGQPRVSPFQAPQGVQDRGRLDIGPLRCFGQVAQAAGEVDDCQ